MRKEIYASLAIADHEVRIVVCEIHNGRLNVLKVERVSHQGITDNKIVNENSIISSITKGLEHIEKTLQFKILRILLLINGQNGKRLTQVFHSDITDPLSRIQSDNIRHLFTQAMSTPPLAGMELINIEVNRYRVNGAYLRKTPINEKTNRLYAEFDFYYGEREHVYQLANIVEKAGLEILDVCLDSFAVGKEAGLFAKSKDQYVIAMNLHQQSVTLGLFYNERLIHTDTINKGVGKFITDIKNSLSIPYDVASRLMYNNVDFNIEQPTDDPVYLWSQDKKSFTCSQRDLMDIIVQSSEDLTQAIFTACEPIIEAGDTKFILVGEGSNLKGIDHLLSETLSSPVELYRPTTLGARDGALASSLGVFYAYSDHRQFQNNPDISVSIVDYEEVMGHKESTDQDFSARFKSFLKDPIRGGTSHD